MPEMEISGKCLFKNNDGVMIFTLRWGTHISGAYFTTILSDRNEQPLQVRQEEYSIHRASADISTVLHGANNDPRNRKAWDEECLIEIFNKLDRLK